MSPRPWTIDTIADEHGLAYFEIRDHRGQILASRGDKRGADLLAMLCEFDRECDVRGMLESLGYGPLPEVFNRVLAAWLDFWAETRREEGRS